MEDSTLFSGVIEQLAHYMQYTAFATLTIGNVVMILTALFFISLAIVKEYEPLVLVPLGVGILLGNISFHPGLQIGVFETGSLLNVLFQGISHGIYPSLIFLGIGAMTDFSALISNPKLVLIGVVTQIGIFSAYFLAIHLGFTSAESGSIALIGGADGPTAIFLSAKLAPELIGAIALSAYTYMALIPIIQPFFMKLLTTEKERIIRMKPPRTISKQEKIIFPLAALILTCFLVPSSIPLLGMLFFGNLLKESTVTKRLSETVKGPMVDLASILIGISVGASAQASIFLTLKTLNIFLLGGLSIVIATIFGVLFVKIMNLFLKEGNKINPLIGNAGLAAVPGSARISQVLGLKYDKTNHLLMHALGPNAAAVIGSALTAGVLITLFF
jgi:carboxybiotin decarboxylase